MDENSQNGKEQMDLYSITQFPFNFTNKELENIITSFSSKTNGVPLKKKFNFVAFKKYVCFNCQDAINWLQSSNFLKKCTNSSRESCSTFLQLFKIIGVIKHIEQKEINFEDKKDLYFKFSKKVTENRLENIIERYNECKIAIYCSYSKKKIKEFYENFQKEIEITERVFQDKIYQDAFIGSQLITWISKNFRICRKTSLRLANQYLHMKLISGFSNEQSIQDEFIPYQVLFFDESCVDNYLSASLDEIISIFLYKTECYYKSNSMRIINTSSLSNTRTSTKVEEKLKMFEKQTSEKVLPTVKSPDVTKNHFETDLKYQTVVKKRGSYITNGRKSSTNSMENGGRRPSISTEGRKSSSASIENNSRRPSIPNLENYSLPKKGSDRSLVSNGTNSFRFNRMNEDLTDDNTDENTPTEKTDNKDEIEETFTDSDYVINFRRSYHFESLDDIYIILPRRHSLPNLNQLEIEANFSENRIKDYSKNALKKLSEESKSKEKPKRYSSMKRKSVRVFNQNAIVRQMSVLDSRKNSLTDPSISYKRTSSIMTKTKNLKKNPVFAKSMRSMEEVTYNEGYLYYLHSTKNVWKKYYFEIKLNSLVKRKTKQSTNTLQMIHLSDKTEVISLKNQEKPFSFKIVNGNSEFLFDTKTEEAFEKWINDLTIVIEDIQRRNVSPLFNVFEPAVASNQQGIIVEMNDKAEKLFQIKKIEMIGKSIKMLMNPPFTFLHESFVKTYNKTEKSNVLEKKIYSIIFTSEDKPIPIEIIHHKLSPLVFKDACFYVEFKEIITNSNDEFLKRVFKSGVNDLFNSTKADLDEYFQDLYLKLNENFKSLDFKIRQYEEMERTMREQVLYFTDRLNQKNIDEQILKTELELFKGNSSIGSIIHLLKNKNVEFQKFCKKCKADGFYNFWIDSEKYRTSKLDKDDLIREATEIYENYFGSSSHQSIKIDSEVALYIKEKIKNSDKNIFRTIQKDVLFQLEEKIYPQFVNVVKKNLIIEDEQEIEEIFINK